MSSEIIALPITGMTCASCAANIERALNKKVDGVLEQHFGGEQQLAVVSGKNPVAAARVQGLHFFACDPQKAIHQTANEVCLWLNTSESSSKRNRVGMPRW